MWSQRLLRSAVVSGTAPSITLQQDSGKRRSESNMCDPVTCLKQSGSKYCGISFAISGELCGLSSLGFST